MELFLFCMDLSIKLILGFFGFDVLLTKLEFGPIKN
jgi:hypothetical protein